jgi:hypothetical protein
LQSESLILHQLAQIRPAARGVGLQSTLTLKLPIAAAGQALQSLQSSIILFDQGL